MLTIPPRVPDGYQAILEIYGDPKAMKCDDGSVTVSAAWESANMRTVRHPLLPRGKIYCHRLVADMLLLTLSDWQSIGNYTIHTFGCFAPRAQRGSHGLLLSTHTWGIAFDLNADTNPMIAPCFDSDPRRQDPSAKNIPDSWIDAARKRGWIWGGDFTRRFDPQHFQAASGY